MRAAPRPPGTLGWPQCSVYRNPAVYTVSNTSEKPRGPSPPPSFEWRNDSGDTRNIGNKGLAWIRVRRPRALLQAFFPPGRYVKASCIHDIRVGLPLATLYTRSLCGIPLSVVWALWRSAHGTRACPPARLRGSRRSIGSAVILPRTGAAPGYLVGGAPPSWRSAGPARPCRSLMLCDNVSAAPLAKSQIQSGSRCVRDDQVLGLAQRTPPTVLKGFRAPPHPLGRPLFRVM